MATTEGADWQEADGEYNDYMGGYKQSSWSEDEGNRECNTSEGGDGLKNNIKPKQTN